MKNKLKNLTGFLALLIVFSGCNKKDYNLGDLTVPSNIVINTEIVGQDATHPNGDGSGDVKFKITADNAITYKIDYDANTALDPVYLPKGEVTKKYTSPGTFTYTVTAIVYGRGGVSSTLTKEITVRSDFAPDPTIVTNLTNDASKTWRVDEDVAGHFGVGPWEPGTTTPVWWAAAPHEKAACCPCFYSAHFTFTKAGTNNYSLQVTSPDGAFTKTGSLTNLPGIPGSGAEACYSYGGGTGAFSFVPASSGAAGSTGVSILLSGNTTYIGYGSLLSEYEIFEITPTYMYLRVQGTETGNAWYLKLESL